MSYTPYRKQKWPTQCHRTIYFLLLARPKSIQKAQPLNTVCTKGFTMPSYHPFLIKIHAQPISRNTYFSKCLRVSDHLLSDQCSVQLCHIVSIRSCTRSIHFIPPVPRNL